MLVQRLAIANVLRLSSEGGGVPGIPTCMNPDAEGKIGGFAGAVGKSGADFKRQFAAGSCRQLFPDAGYHDAKV